MMQTETIATVYSSSTVVRPIEMMLQRNPEMLFQKSISGWRKEFLNTLMFMTIVKIMISNYRNPLQWFKILSTLNQYRKVRLNESRINRMFYVDGKYYWRLYFPGWPSKAYDQCMEAELSRLFPIDRKTNRFTNIYLAVTNKCPLACEHCYEWDALNKREKLSLPELQTIVQRFQEKGTSQIHITGGEPLVRINDILQILNSAGKQTDFWVLTSGFNLTFENAKKLKHAGLTGVMISLDHFEPEVHNLFRGMKDSFQWVEKAVQNSIQANLVTVLSICVTKSFVTEDNLMQYLRLAKKWGVSFIQILEPRAVGHYRGQNVDLNREQEKIVEEFYLKVNHDSAYNTYPIICYHGYHQRRIGCMASGDRSLYVDTVGDIHACPFCQSKTGNALDDDMDHAIELLQAGGCHKF